MATIEEVNKKITPTSLGSTRPGTLTASQYMPTIAGGTNPGRNYAMDPAREQAKAYAANQQAQASAREQAQASAAQRLDMIKAFNSIKNGRTANTTASTAVAQPVSQPTAVATQESSFWPTLTPTANTTQRVADPKTINDYYTNRQADSESRINSLYDLQRNNAINALKGSYDQSLSDQEYAKSQIAPQFRQSANSMATQYERNKRNLNMQAMANGLNTGTGSQQQLALNNVWQRGYADLQGQRAQSLAAADKGIADLKTSYQNQISQAIADNDYKRAAALLDDYNNNQSWLETSAKNLAAMGDFSGYALLYGQAQADAMRQTWIASNPDLAWNLKLIDAAEYKRMTGRDAPGTVTASKGGGGYTGGSPGVSNIAPDGTPYTGRVNANGQRQTQGQVDAAAEAIANMKARLASAGQRDTHTAVNNARKPQMNGGR